MKKTFSVIIVLITLSIIGILFIQITWLQGLFLLQRNQLSEKINQTGVLVVTDIVGTVRVYRQDLKARVLSLPKHGTLTKTIPQAPTTFGDWRESFEVGLNGALKPIPGRTRHLGLCYIARDSSTLETYRNCPDLDPYRELGDVSERSLLTYDRYVSYQPSEDYLGPDFFTYEIIDGVTVQS